MQKLGISPVSHSSYDWINVKATYLAVQSNYTKSDGRFDQTSYNYYKKVGADELSNSFIRTTLYVLYASAVTFTCAKKECITAFYRIIW